MSQAYGAQNGYYLEIFGTGPLVWRPARREVVARVKSVNEAVWRIEWRFSK
jgi:hypothetical protein